jgi:hypothetical protein
MVSPELVSVINNRLSLHIGQMLDDCDCGSIIKNYFRLFRKSSAYISHADINGDGYPLQLSKT